jgi:hypothetical protein
MTAYKVKIKNGWKNIVTLERKTFYDSNLKCCNVTEGDYVYILPLERDGLTSAEFVALDLESNIKFLVDRCRLAITDAHDNLAFSIGIKVELVCNNNVWTEVPDIIKKRKIKV